MMKTNLLLVINTGDKLSAYYSERLGEKYEMQLQFIKLYLSI
jgi:hypothetical protein